MRIWMYCEKVQEVKFQEICIKLLPKQSDRQGFMESMKEQRIQTSIHYPPIHTFSAYAGINQKYDLTITEDVAQREVTLPLYPALSRDDILTVVQAVRKSLN